MCQRSRIYRLVNVGNRTRDASVECRIYDVELNGRFETADKNIQFGAHWLASLSASVLIHFALVSWFVPFATHLCWMRFFVPLPHITIDAWSLFQVFVFFLVVVAFLDSRPLFLLVVLRFLLCIPTLLQHQSTVLYMLVSGLESTV